MPTTVAANSLQTLGSLQSGDFGRPMARQDIFYTGSVVHLPQYRASKGNLSQYRQSTISIPQGLHHCDEVPLAAERWECFEGEGSSRVLQYVEE